MSGVRMCASHSSSSRLSSNTTRAERARTVAPAPPTGARKRVPAGAPERERSRRALRRCPTGSGRSCAAARRPTAIHRQDALIGQRRRGCRHTRAYLRHVTGALRCRAQPRFPFPSKRPVDVRRSSVASERGAPGRAAERERQHREITRPPRARRGAAARVGIPAFWYRHAFPLGLVCPSGSETTD